MALQWWPHATQAEDKVTTHHLRDGGNLLWPISLVRLIFERDTIWDVNDRSRTCSSVVPTNRTILIRYKTPPPYHDVYFKCNNISGASEYKTVNFSTPIYIWIFTVLSDLSIKNMNEPRLCQSTRWIAEESPQYPNSHVWNRSKNSILRGG